MIPPSPQSAPNSSSPAIPARSHHVEAPSFDWREYYYAIKSRAWILIVCVLLSTLYGVYTAAHRKVAFQARSVLFIEQSKNKVLSGKLEGVSDDQIKSVDMINTLVDLIRSYPFALQVVKHMKLSQDRDFLDALGLRGEDISADVAAGRLAGMVSCNYRLNTRLIDIFITSPRADLSVKLANGYAEEYLRYIHDQKSEAAQSATTSLMDEADRLRKKMRASEEGMQAFRERERAASMESMLSEAQGQISELSARQSAINTKLTQIESDLQVAKDNKGNTEALLRLPSVGGEPKVATLVNQLTTLKNEFVLVQQRYRAKHPSYINVKTQIDLAQKQLNEVLDDVVGLIDAIRKNLIVQQESAKLQRDIAEKRLLQVTSKSIEYNDLKRELETDKALYDSVLSRIKEVDVTKEFSDSPVQLQEKAIGASPVGKAPLAILLNSIMSGFAVGLAIIIGLHKLDTSIKTVDQIEHLTGLPVVAAIPKITSLTNAKRGSSRKVGRDLTTSEELVAKEDRSGIVAEAFRSLRASVAMNVRVEKQRSFLFTSAVPSEGKSFSSANFSTVLAQQGLKTLLIDADLRKPSISSIFFNANRKPGLTEVLLGKEMLKDAVNDSGIEGLEVLTAGGLASNPSELLSGQPFRQLLEEVLKTYDRVVIDSAPILAVSDTLLIAPGIDVVCIVVRSFLTPRKMVSRAMKELSAVHVTPAGVLLNCLPSSGGSYAYYYSHKYYGTYGGKGVYGS